MQIQIDARISEKIRKSAADLNLDVETYANILLVNAIAEADEEAAWGAANRETLVKLVEEAYASGEPIEMTPDELARQMRQYLQKSRQKRSA